MLVNGVAGFIGASLAKWLLTTTDERVVGIDSMNDYYNVAIKEARLAEIGVLCISAGESRFAFIRGDIANRNTLDAAFGAHQPQVVVHLAVQADVQYSITHPDS